MNPFEPTGPEVPAAPVEIPTPNLPPANFLTIGAGFAKGFLSQVDWSTLPQAFLNWLANLLAWIIAYLLGQIEQVVAWFLRLMFKVWANSEGTTSQIAATAVSGIFRTPISAAQLGQVGSSNAGAGIGNGLFDTITNSLGAGFTGANAKPLSPSEAGAEQFINRSIDMAVEGWLQDWVSETFSLGYVKDLGKLKESIERSLGLGRLARRVLGPPVKVLVEDPLTWLLNSTYLPTQLSQGVAVKEYVRGQIDLEQLTKILSYVGVGPDQIPALVNDARPHLGAAQLVELVNGGAIDQSAAIQELQNAGYDNTTANLVWQAEQFSRQRALALQYVAAAEAAMVARKLDTAAFDAVVDGLTVQSGSMGLGTGDVVFTASTFTCFTATEAALIKATAVFKRNAAKQLVPLGQALQLFEAGLIGLDDYHRLLVLHGYPDGEATADQWNANVDAAIGNDLGTPWIDLWELWAFGKAQAANTAAQAKANAAKAKAIAAATKLAAAQAKAAAAAADSEAKGVSIAKYETLVLDGLKTIQEYQTFLTGKGLSADNVAAFTTVLQQKLNAAGAAGAATGQVIAGSKAKALNVSQLAAAAKQGFVSIDQYVADLEALGYSASDAQLLGEVLKNEISAAAVKAQTSAAAAAALGDRHVSLAQEENAVLLGIQTPEQYEAMLQAAGFAPEDQAILVGALKARLATTQAAAAKKAAAAGVPGTKPLNLAELERAVRAGIKTPADYQTALVDAGYTPDAVQSLMSLLQLVINNDAHVAAATGKSSGLLTSGGLSLADIRTAVKLGVVPIATYDSALQAAGLGNADAAVLHASLAAQLSAAASTTAAVKRVNGLLAGHGETLGDLENQVLSGSMSIPSFQASLAGAGVTASDVAGLTALVQDKLANQVATTNLVAGVTQAAAAKSLNLAQETAAVKAGVLTIDDYKAFVQGLGYDAADVDVLVATEASKLGVSVPGASSTSPAA